MPAAPCDPTLYLGSAAHYLPGRPPYSATLADVVRAQLDLDGTGRLLALLDVGCGPGVLAVQLAGLFEAVIGIDPDPDKIAGVKPADRAAPNTTRWPSRPRVVTPAGG